LVFVLQLKPEFGINYRLFGGAEGYSNWMDTCVDPSCSKEVISLFNFSYSVVIASYELFVFFNIFLYVQQKERVSNLMGNFVSGLVGLMSNLVQRWTALGDNAGADLSRQFGNFSEGLMRGGSCPAAPAARPTHTSTRGKKGACSGVPYVGTSSNVNIDDEPILRSEGIMRGGSSPAGPAARHTRALSRGKKGACSGVPYVVTSSNINLDDEPILVSESSSSEDAPSDTPEFRYDSDEDDDDEDVSQYFCAPRKQTPG
jgi:hypothetical protein